MGVVINIPAALPSVITVPIKPVAQPCDCRNTPTNGPIPDCMSAIKKFRPSKGQSRVDVADGAFLLLALMARGILASGWRRHPVYFRGFRLLSLAYVEQITENGFEANGSNRRPGQTDRTYQGDLRDDGYRGEIRSCASRSRDVPGSRGRPRRNQ